MATIDELGLTPYQRIMGQMTPTMNPYTGADVAVGGYDPALYRRASGSGLINSGFGGLGGLGGGGGGGGSDYSDPNPSWSNMTDAEKAAFYAANPTMAGITQFGQKAFGYTSLGALQRAMQPGFVSDQGLIAMGVNPAAYQNAKEGFRSLEQNADPGYYGFGPLGDQVFSPEVDTSLESQGAYSAPAADNSGGGGYSGSVGADYGGSADAGIGGSPADADSGAGGYGNNDSSYGGFYNMGGLVDRVGGPNPAGPDNGAGMLQLGEKKKKKSAVKKNGQELLDMINDGKKQKKKMKSLLG